MATIGNNSSKLAAKLASDALDSRKRLLELIADFDREQMLGPTMDIVNPPPEPENKQSDDDAAAG